MLNDRQRGNEHEYQMVRRRSARQDGEHHVGVGGIYMLRRTFDFIFY